MPFWLSSLPIPILVASWVGAFSLAPGAKSLSEEKPRVLGQLCQIREEELLELERRKVAWARRHLPQGADSQVGRVVDRFALVALAGELAAKWGLVPWPAGQADWAAEVCLQAWLAQRGGIGAGEHVPFCIGRILRPHFPHRMRPGSRDRPWRATPRLDGRLARN